MMIVNEGPLLARGGSFIRKLVTDKGMSRELIISEPGSVAVCGIRSHNGFAITNPGFKFSAHTGHDGQR
jgi:hypothetical protein